MKKFILIFMAILFTNLVEAKCHKYLSTESFDESATATDVFIAYISKLLSERMISEDQIESMLKNLERSQRITNPISLSSVNSNNKIHYKSLQEYIDSNKLDQNQVLQWLEQFLKKEKIVQDEKDKSKKQTENPVIEMKFYPVKSGEIRNYLLKVEHAFEMTSTPITQRMWMQHMKKNPSKFSDNSLTVRNDFPVQNINWWSALVYANKVSKSEGLPEVYDLSELVYISGTAEMGDLQYQGYVKINAPNGDIYKAKGYRLPTMNEMRYVQELAFNHDSSADEAEAYFKNDPNNYYYPVADLKPFILDGSVFYDLFGHVAYYTNDFTIRKPKGNFYVEIIQGSYNRILNNKKLFDRKKLSTSSVAPEFQEHNASIRLVRTLSNP